MDDLAIRTGARDLTSRNPMSDKLLPTEASAFLKQTKEALKTTDVGGLLQLVDKFIWD